ncbi:uncharacterized protein LOC127131620 [Lathyrus oleraceus]|uniref:uncharacterized protein LOC127131620 n=1 Tax=Pisum sativum TaxID=3888 RepID=UPI0021D03D7A|nr:uncharacterized protein LOC127131620 [Pisum sativum]
MKALQSHQKSYLYKRSKALEFVFLRVTPILQRIREVVYQISLSLPLANLYGVFHGSQLRRYIPDPSHVIQVDDVQVRDNMSVKASLIQIEDREVKQLHGKEISLVKVVWGGPAGGSMTWEHEK